MATALFALFTRPTFEHVRVSQAEAAGYTQALKDAELLNKRINELVQQKESLPEPEMDKLNVLIPEKIDEVATVMTLDNLAAKHFLIFSDIAIASDNPGTRTGTSKAAESRELPNAPEEETIEAVSVKFSVSGTYEDFRAFVADVESTLSLMDVADLSVSGEDPEKPSVYVMTVLIYHTKSSD